MLVERYSLFRRGVVAIPVLGDVLEGVVQSVEAYQCAFSGQSLAKMSPSDYGVCMRDKPDCKYLNPESCVCHNGSIVGAQRRARDLEHSIANVHASTAQD